MLEKHGFENVHTEIVTVPNWIRGDIAVAIEGGDKLTAIALGGSPATPKAEALAASVVRVDSLEALDAIPDEEIAGRIVFFDVRMRRAQDGGGYGETVWVRGKGTTAAAAKGAAAVVVRSVGTSSEDVAHTGSMRYLDKIAEVPAAALSNRSADALAAALQVDPGLKLSVRITARWGDDKMSANVVGEIPGSGKGVVLLGAHLDSWGVGQGANDDAAGVAIVTEAARQAGTIGGELKRTLRVVLYANEEFGLSGGLAYAKAHADEVKDIVVAMEADFGSGAVWQLASRVDEAALPAVEAIRSVLTPLGVAAGNNESHGGADIGPLVKLGVPVLGPVQDGTAYFDVHHTHADTLERIDRAGLTQNVASYAVSAYLAAQYGPGNNGITGAG